MLEKDRSFLRLKELIAENTPIVNERIGDATAGYSYLEWKLKNQSFKLPLYQQNTIDSNLIV